MIIQMHTIGPQWVKCVQNIHTDNINHDIDSQWRTDAAEIYVTTPYCKIIDFFLPADM